MINPHYSNLAGSYLFSEVARRLNEHIARRPDADLIRLGIGDITRPLPASVVAALRRAVEEQGDAAGIRGYGPEQGYAFLREAVAETAYAGLPITADEIFIGDGAKSDLGNFQELFDENCRVAITDPVYPVYADSNVMAGRAGPRGDDGRFRGLTYLPCLAENGFVPDLPRQRLDVIYLCSPNNPTGAALSRDQLAGWVGYARENGSVILFDAAYEAFVSTPGIPRSIYEIDGAREVAVEFRSYSKSAGFTGLRCGCTVVPKSLRRDGMSLHAMWHRRQSTKYNGCPYIVQRAAEAVHTDAGRRECRELVAGYMANAGRIRQAFASRGLEVCGGVDAPYVWLQLPRGMGSWDFFDLLLDKADIAGTPGAGFGACGEGYFRLTGFGKAEDTEKAVERIRTLAI